MAINFSALGLNFEAEVSFSRSFKGSHFEPPEPSEATILSLSVGGSDALFLLDSVMADNIYEAVYCLPQEDRAHVSTN